MITTLIIFAILFLCVLLWIIFTPVLLEVDSDTHYYAVRQPGTLMIRFRPFLDFRWDIRVFGLRIPVKNRTTQKKKKRPSPGERKKSFHRSPQTWFDLMVGVMKSFRVRKLWIDVDTDDVVLNAQLVPVMLLFSYRHIRMTTNYNGRVSCQALVEGRLNKLIWALFRFLTKK